MIQYLLNIASLLHDLINNCNTGDIGEPRLFTFVNPFYISVNIANITECSEKRNLFLNSYLL